MNKNPLRAFDLTLLPAIESMDIFIRLDDDVEAAFKKLEYLQETYERTEASLMFLFQTTEKDKAWRNDARFRAGLNEFYSLEAAVARDLRAAKINANPIKIHQSCNPLVHLMHLLRHVGVHSKPVRTEVASVNVISSIGGESHDYSYGAVMLEPITISDLYRSAEARNCYKASDLEEIIEWFNSVQQIFGASEIFRRGVSNYCREIIIELPLR